MNSQFQVDIGLTFGHGKQKYEHMFDIKTPGRNYYLAADSYEDMTTWVRIVCAACGLRQDDDEDEEVGGGKELQEENDTDAGFTTADLSSAAMPPPPSRTRTVAAAGPSLAPPAAAVPLPDISSPYIHISTCYTGGVHPRAEEFKQKQLSPPSPTKPPRVMASAAGAALELSNYDMGDDSVFLSGSGTDEADSSFSPGRPVKTDAMMMSSIPMPPSRPPKPPHLARTAAAPPSRTAGTDMMGENYENSTDMQALYQKEAAESNNNTSQWPMHPAGSAPPPPRELKPGRNAVGSAYTVDPKVMMGGGGGRSYSKSKSRQQHFSTMAPSSKAAAMGASASSVLPSPPAFAPPIVRDLKPKTNGRWDIASLNAAIRFFTGSISFQILPPTLMSGAPCPTGATATLPRGCSSRPRRPPCQGTTTRRSSPQTTPAFPSTETRGGTQTKRNRYLRLIMCY